MITTLTHNHGGQVVLHKIFGIGIPVWVHHIIVKALAIIPAIYCMQSAGAEGIYQLLLYCQVILAMLFPASVIPLFRVLSSKWMMGYFNISWHLEIFASTAFLGILAPSVVFTLDMLFGNSSWMVDLNEDMENGSILPYILLLLAFIYMGFTLYLAAISLRSANAGPDLQICNLELHKYLTEQSDSREETDSSKVIYEKDQFSAAEITSDVFLECHSHFDDTIFEPNLDPHEAIIGSQNGGHESVLCLTSNGAYASRAFHTDEVNSTVDMGLLETLDELSSCWLDNMGSKDSNKKGVGMEANLQIEKNDKQGGISESLKAFSVSSTSEIPETFKNTRVRGDVTSRTDGKVGPSGLGRGGRRQFAAILDEFWGHMFDLHGKLTEEAKAKSVDILLGLESETPSVSTNPENAANVSSQKSSPKAGRGTVSPTTSAEYRSLTKQNITSDISPYIMQTRFSSLPANIWFLDSESFNKYNDRDVHIRYGSEIPSNVGQTSTDQNFVDQLLSPMFDEPYDSYYGDQLTDTLARNGSNYSFKTGFEDPAAYGSSRLPFERPYNEPPLVGTSSSSHFTKNYHGLPNVSSLDISGGNSSLNDTSDTQCDLFSSYLSLNITEYEQSRYPNLISATKEVPLKFDEYSSPNHHKGVFSEPLNMNLDPESLWARPYERHFTTTIKAKNQGDSKPGAAKRILSYAESEAMILQSLRCCIIKLLKLEESSWLFVQNGGCDEELIDQIAALERISLVQSINKADKMNEVEDFSYFPFLMPDCGDNCIWQASLIVSFGVWCIHRTIELLLVESRPELWGKYTYVLNRLQGILEPAFCKPRSLLIPCKCLELTEVHENEFQHPKGSPGGCQNTTASLILGIIKNVEAAISGRKGPSSTAAGNIAFPKGKVNVTSVLKRYKRRLSNK